MKNARYDIPYTETYCNLISLYPNICDARSIESRDPVLSRLPKQ